MTCTIATGSIYETEITFEESILKPRRSYFAEVITRAEFTALNTSSTQTMANVTITMLLQVYKLMYDLSDPCEPITGLLLEPFPNRQNKFYILATTPRRYESIQFDQYDTIIDNC